MILGLEQKVSILAQESTALETQLKCCSDELNPVFVGEKWSR